MNNKVYIHELIDIRGPHRADYMYHMLANYSPVGREERGQQCFGVWGVLGSTGRWPQVVNIWEEDGFDGLARSWEHETSHPSMQDPKLARWWDQAAEFRSGGFDRILVPAPWTRPIAEVLEAGIGGVVYAHEIVTLPSGAAPSYLDALQSVVPQMREEFGWQLVGAWQTAMSNASECVVLWAAPSWGAWANFEKEAVRIPALGRPEHQEIRTVQRTLLIDAPLAPLRIRRQPERSDRSRVYQE